MTLKKLSLIWASGIFALVIIGGALQVPSESQALSALDAKAAPIYLQSAKASAEHNGRDLTRFEEQELWQFSKLEAATDSRK